MFVSTLILAGSARGTLIAGCEVGTPIRFDHVGPSLGSFDAEPEDLGKDRGRDVLGEST